jgi:hypothetical protein
MIMAWTDLDFTAGDILLAAELDAMFANFAAMAAGDPGAPAIISGINVVHDTFVSEISIGLIQSEYDGIVTVHVHTDATTITLYIKGEPSSNTLNPVGHKYNTSIRFKMPVDNWSSVECISSDDGIVEKIIHFDCSTYDGFEDFEFEIRTTNSGPSFGAEFNVSRLTVYQHK